MNNCIAVSILRFPTKHHGHTVSEMISITILFFIICEETPTHEEAHNKKHTYV